MKIVVNNKTYNIVYSVQSVGDAYDIWLENPEDYNDVLGFNQLDEYTQDKLWSLVNEEVEAGLQYGY